MKNLYTVLLIILGLIALELGLLAQTAISIDKKLPVPDLAKYDRAAEDYQAIMKAFPNFINNFRRIQNTFSENGMEVSTSTDGLEEIQN